MKHPVIHFTKMHGAGNDYIYVNTLAYDILNPEETARKWSAWHTGIGSDGLVLIGKPSIRSGADFSMRIFNADGSEAMMCGNASRCIGKYLYEKKLTDKKKILLETLSGVKVLQLDVCDEQVRQVTVDMLEPALHNADQYDESVGLEEVLAYGKAMFVSMGNPHCVIFVDDLNQVDVAAIGSKLEYAKVCPQRCNIEFVQPLGGNRVRARVWERGSGITMACGTGACATAVAAASMGYTDRHCEVVMDGGTLSIEWDAATNHVFLSGPATFVFEGEIAL